MKSKWLVCIPMVLLLAGCATGKKVTTLENRVESLENKVNSVEQKQSAVETAAPKIETAQAVGTQESKTQTSLSSMSKKDIQTALKNAGYYKGPVDGHIGRNTRKAIRVFQKANGLKADGIVGTKTKELLAKYLTQ